MKKIYLTLFFLLSVFLSFTQRTCGTNLAWARYWAPQIMFKDLFKQASPWLTKNATGSSPWNTNVTIPMRADGYPTSVPFGTTPQYVHTLLFNGAGGKYPSGQYTILSEGTGTIQMEWDCGNQTFTSPCNNTFNVNPTNQGMHLTITASSETDPIRNIRVIMPGFANDYQTQPFYPPILNYIDSADVFKALRFMDLMNTNNSTVSSWSQRTLQDYYTQAGSTNAGMNYEYMIQLCNLTNKDMWISIPHLADDNYIQRFANLVRDSLNPNLKVYVEYSNEVWNNIFQQNTYSNTQGAALGYTGQAWEQGWQFYAKRSADIHTVFEQALGVNRLVKVISSQAGNSYIANYIIQRYNNSTYNPSGVKADALAIAPYFGNNLADSIGAANASSTITVPELLDLMHARINNQVLPQITSNKTVANNFGLDLIAYEGGTHVVATNNTYFTNAELTSKIIAANNDPYMENIYCDYFDAWYNNGGGLFMNFTGPAFSSGQWASLSIINDMEQPLYSSFKWRAMQTCASESSTLDVSKKDDETKQIEIYPNPTRDKLILDPSLNWSKVEVINGLGKVVQTQINSNQEIDVQHLAAGLYTLKIIDNSTTPKIIQFVKY